MVLILITLLVGSLGGIIAKRLKIPAPFMIGSMAAVAACIYFNRPDASC